VDELGRVVLPAELRQTMEIAEKDPIEIFVDGDRIVLQKYKPSCVFCGSTHEVVGFKGHNVCRACVQEARSL